MRFERRQTLRLRKLHFHVPVFSILGLILRIVAEHVLIPQFHSDSSRDTGQIALQHCGERAPAGLRRDFGKQFGA